MPLTGVRRCRKIGTSLGKKGHKDPELQGFLRDSPVNQTMRQISFNVVCILTSNGKVLILVRNIIYGEQPAGK
jgi:hypothetical protein